VQIVSDPDGHPVAVSDVEPGSTHDLAAARATGFLGALHAAAALLGLPALADKGCHGAGAGVLTPTTGGNPHPDNLIRNLLLGCRSGSRDATTPRPHVSGSAGRKVSTRVTGVPIQGFRPWQRWGSGPGWVLFREP
jgi:DDE superfamily endonuclease